MRDESSALATDNDLKSRSKDVEWYDPELKELQPAARELLEEYAGIASEKVEEHVHAIRDRAWDIFPYPCIGGFRFLMLSLCTTPQYRDTIKRLQSGEKLLDLGCCFGQEMRRLVLDDAPAENLVGVDLRPEFFDLGYEMFGDRETCTSRFIVADVFQPNEDLDALNATFSIVYAGAFLHLFDWPEQVQVAKRIVKLLSSSPGSMVVGRQVGNVQAGRYEHVTNRSGWMYRHNEQSFQELWDEVGRETGTKWKAEVELREAARFRKSGWYADGARTMHFVVTRL